MKIEICNKGDFGYVVYDSNKDRIIENHKTLLHKIFWKEEDIFELLSDRQYKQFENGKFEFTVTKKDIFRVAQNNLYFK